MILVSGCFPCLNNTHAQKEPRKERDWPHTMPHTCARFEPPIARAGEGSCSAPPSIQVKSSPAIHLWNRGDDLTNKEANEPHLKLGNR
jgi:hypothetical protein